MNTHYLPMVYISYRINRKYKCYHETFSWFTYLWQS